MAKFGMTAARFAALALCAALLLGMASCSGGGSDNVAWYSGYDTGAASGGGTSSGGTTDGGSSDTQAGGGQTQSGGGAAPATQIKYTIKFSKSSYGSRTVTGTLPSDIACEYGQEYELPQNNLSCAGKDTLLYRKYYIYKASGWTDSEYSYSYSSKGKWASGEKVKNLASKDGATVTLYPCFVSTDTYLTFYMDDSLLSSISDRTIIYLDDGEVLSESVIPTADKKDGYGFEGWYLDGDDTKTLVDFKNYKAAGKATFRPKYTAGKYTARFVTEHGTAPEPVTWTYEQYSSEYAADLTRGVYLISEKGWKFEGWYEEGKSYSTSCIRKSDSSDMTLTAKWAPWTATLYYNQNAPSGATVLGHMDFTSLTYNVGTSLADNVYRAQGYKFKGWNTKKDGSGTAYADGDIFKWAGDSNNETCNLYAQWEKLPATIKVSIAKPSSDSDLTIGLSQGNPSFLAKFPGATVFKWYVDGVLVQNETGATLPFAILTAGQHTIMATTEFGGRSYGATIVVAATLES